MIIQEPDFLRNVIVSGKVAFHQIEKLFVNHWKFMELLVLDLNYFSFSHPNPNHNLTHLTEHESLNPNHQFAQRIWYVEYYSV